MHHFGEPSGLLELPHLPEADRASISQFATNSDGYLVWVGDGNKVTEGISKTLWGRTSTGLSQTYNWGRPIQFVDRWKFSSPNWYIST